MRMRSYDIPNHHSHSADLYSTYKLFFGALATDSRLHILNALRHKPRCVSDICEDTGYEQSLVSHNLKILEHHGMVFCEKKGKFRYYKLNEKTITPLLKLIDEHMRKYCCKILEMERG